MYLADGTNPPVFRHVAAPGAKDLQDLVERIAARMGRLLEKRGIIERDSESAWLSAEMTGPLDDLLGTAITYRIAMGPRAGHAPRCGFVIVGIDGDLVRFNQELAQIGRRDAVKALKGHASTELHFDQLDYVPNVHLGLPNACGSPAAAAH